MTAAVEQVEEPNQIATADSHRYPWLYQMGQQLQAEAALEAGETRNTMEFQLGIMEGILSGETEEEIFAAQSAGGISGQDFVNTPFMLHESGLTFVQTAIKKDNVFPFYVQMTVKVIATGEEHSVTCGGSSVVPVLYALRAKGFLGENDGKALTLIEKPTASGYQRLELQPYNPPKPKSRSKSA